jgi:UDP-N-acetylmuramate dehydrogenase
MNIIEDINKLHVGRMEEDIDLKKYTTYKAGGHAKAIVYPTDIDNLIKLLKYLKDSNVKHKVIGNCSNLLFSDSYYDGILIKLSEFNHIKIEDTKILVGSGYHLTKLALQASREGLTGLEFAVGIPGTVGGAVYMNAGAYKSDMGYIVSEIKVLTPNFEIKTMYNKELAFHYRTSFLEKNKGYICLDATIILKHGDSKAIMDLIEERKKRRLMSQPLEWPSAGSVFRNPENDFAGRLVEELGYKGKGIGDAIVSEKHANFIINMGHANGDDIKKLIRQIQADVKEKTGVELKVEQEFVE